MIFYATDDSTSTPKQRKKFSKSLKKSFRIRRPLLVDYFVIVDYSIYKWCADTTIRPTDRFLCKEYVILLIEL